MAPCNECACQPFAATRSASVAPLARLSISIRMSCFVPRRVRILASAFGALWWAFLTALRASRGFRACFAPVCRWVLGVLIILGPPWAWRRPIAALPPPKAPPERRPGQAGPESPSPHSNASFGREVQSENGKPEPLTIVVPYGPIGVGYQAYNLKVAGSNPAPTTNS